MANGSFEVGLPCFVLSCGLMGVVGSGLWLFCCYRASRYAPKASSAQVCRLLRFAGLKGAHLTFTRVESQFEGSLQFAVVLSLFAALASAYVPYHLNLKAYDLKCP